ncbi:MAG: NUDIX domain-containing protein [Candidatus Moranbacteria bacterium]|nr:NUDIX domain-containing protein [Candidatus Moranbacteria bacterium]
MPEEYLDIVDENGDLTGEKELRSVCHEKGLWHRIVVAVLFRKNKDSLEILVHLRSKFKEGKPNTWDPKFGGHVKSGHTLEEGLEDELWDEIGLKIDRNLLIQGYSGKHYGVNNCEIGYVDYYPFNDDTESLKFNDGEVQEVKWMKEQDILKDIEYSPEKWNHRLESMREIFNDMKSKI